MSEQLEFEYKDRDYILARSGFTKEQLDRAQDDYETMLHSTRRVKNKRLIEPKNETYSYILLSGGKDSVTLVHKLIEENRPINAVCYIDTRCEFPVMHRNAMKCMNWVEKWNLEHGTNIKTFILKPKLNFWEAFESGYKRNSKNGNTIIPSKRYVCRKLLRVDVIDEFHENLVNSGYTRIIEYVGKNADDKWKTKNNFVKPYSALSKYVNDKYPLAEIGWTNKQSLAFAESLGYDYEGFYDDFAHGYCICCPHRPLGEWRRLWLNYTEIWEFLRKKLIIAPNLKVLNDYTFFDLEKRFQYEVAYCKDNPALYTLFLNQNTDNPSKKIPDDFYVSLYLMLGANNPDFQKKADERLAISLDNNEVNFFETEKQELYIPIAVYNIFDGKEYYYLDYHEFADFIHMPPSIVREYAERSLSMEYSNKEKLLNYQWLIRYTFGKEYVPYEGYCVPNMKLYGWNMDERPSERAHKRMQETKRQLEGISNKNISYEYSDFMDKYEANRQITEMREEIISEGFIDDETKLQTMKDLLDKDVMPPSNSINGYCNKNANSNFDLNNSKYTKQTLEEKIEIYNKERISDFNSFKDDTGLYDL